ncbi:LamB/YcsF family protein [Methylocapsa sp. S129]|uniref:LamB/YcsF family protein n=1 Tax=Methylocapsa sp. S129 TaxID=1641869 RepID=UPI00131D58FC|nr:5-oxoprolinase subunit PxpA [Methylocapsa sp. S129]
MKVDLNSDLGESFGAWTMGDDAAMLDIVTSANVACGFHAGDPIVMHRTIAAARDRGVSVGAHPGFLDLWGFGRRPIQGESPSDIEKIIVYQVGAAIAVAAAAGWRVTHVKTHGSMGNMAMVDPALADAIAKAVHTVDRDLILVVMPALELEKAGMKRDLALAREIYADRTYDDNGNLTSRKKEGAVLHDPAAAAARVLRMIEEQAVTTVSGRKLPVRIDSVCVHGDKPEAVAMARAVRESLEAAGVELRPFVEFVRS